PEGHRSGGACSAAAAGVPRAARVGAVWSTPASCALLPGPRAEASSVPPLATRATSVLLLPPSMASTAANAVSAKASRAQGKRHQGDGGVLVGGLDRGPGDHVVLVGGGRGVERREGTRPAGAHPLDRAAPDTVPRAARTP